MISSDRTKTGTRLQLTSSDAKTKIWSKPLRQGRYLIGSSEACDVFIMDSSIAPIHCVIEIFHGEVVLYNLDLKIGSKVNNEKIITKQLRLNDVISLGNVNLVLDYWKDRDDSPVLPPDAPMSSTKEFTGHIRNQPFEKIESSDEPRIIYPFNVNYNFDTSEYIFEETEKLYPVFRYGKIKTSVEVIIIFKNRILSVDYITTQNGTYKLAGVGKNKDQIEFAYLPKSDNVEFLEVKNNEYFIHNLYDFNVKVFSKDQEKNKAKLINLLDGEIVNFTKGDLSIVIRNVESPPQVLIPPVLPRDKSVLWLAFMAFLFVSIPMYFLSKREIDQDELSKLKAPERVATILYNRPKMKEPVKPSKPKPKPEQKPPQPKVEKVQEKKEAPKKIADQTVKKRPPEKTPQKGSPPKAQQTKAAAPSQQKTAAQSKTNRPSATPSKSKSRPSATASPTPTSKGTVDVYKSNQFASSVSSLVARGGQVQSAQTKSVSGGTPGASAASPGVAGSAGVKSATVSDRIGDRTGALQGAQDFSSGAKGLVTGKGFHTAGIPSETVILGSMDPDLIRKILRDHLPQFRFCYQKELDRSGQNFSGALRVVFTIGASGNVTNAGVDGASTLPAPVRGCVINVLRGIQFPRPAGGGVVEVKQPINFYPKQ